MMQQWCSPSCATHQEAKSSDDLVKLFRQQMDPLTGEFTQPDPGGYSPAALVFLDFARRLSKG
jgi:hypothetical protein